MERPRRSRSGRSAERRRRRRADARATSWSCSDCAHPWPEELGIAQWMKDERDVPAYRITQRDI
jgi:hypothetical protein